MKKKFRLNKRVATFVAVALAVLAIAVGAWALWPQGAANKSAGPQTINGYLICQKCGLAGKCGSIDLTVHPEKHTLKCMKDPDCIASGYGISVKQPNGKYKFYSFDSNGSILALDGIIFNTKRADNLMVQVIGTVKGDRINAESVKEALPEATASAPNANPGKTLSPATKPAATK